MRETPDEPHFHQSLIFISFLYIQRDWNRGKGKNLYTEKSMFYTF